MLNAKKRAAEGVASLVSPDKRKKATVSHPTNVMENTSDDDSIEITNVKESDYDARLARAYGLCRDPDRIKCLANPELRLAELLLFTGPVIIHSDSEFERVHVANQERADQNLEPIEAIMDMHAFDGDDFCELVEHPDDPMDSREHVERRLKQQPAASEVTSSVVSKLQSNMAMLAYRKQRCDKNTLGTPELCRFGKPEVPAPAPQKRSTLALAAHTTDESALTAFHSACVFKAPASFEYLERYCGKKLRAVRGSSLTDMWDTVKTIDVPWDKDSILRDSLALFHDSFMKGGFCIPANGVKIRAKDLYLVAQKMAIIPKNDKTSQTVFVRNCWANIMNSIARGEHQLLRCFIRELLFLLLVEDETQL